MKFGRTMRRKKSDKIIARSFAIGYAELAVYESSTVKTNKEHITICFEHQNNLLRDLADNEFMFWMPYAMKAYWSKIYDLMYPKDGMIHPIIKPSRYR